MKKGLTEIFFILDKIKKIITKQQEKCVCVKPLVQTGVNQLQNILIKRMGNKEVLCLEQF